MKKYILFLLCYFNVLTAQEITWSEHIAPIIYNNCASCHHNGGIASFPLMSYFDVVPYIHEIEHAITERSMPPWPADPNYQHFVGEAYLKQATIDSIICWIEGDAPYGDGSLEPSPPYFANEGSLLEQIDYTITMEPYTLQSNVDEYRWFVMENPFDEPIYIHRMEVIPGLKNVVHHADLFTDLTDISLNYDLADSLSGFNSSTGYPHKDQYINAWQPGANIAVYPENWGFVIPPNAYFVFEIHYGPGGIGQTDTTKVNLQFMNNPTEVRPVHSAWLLYDSPPVLTDGPLVIPANEVVTFHHQSQPLSQGLSLISICPHMHLLGKSFRVWFENPQGDSIPLIDIPHWDFHWQKYYAFQQIKKIPAGSILKSEGVYDNTLENHDNPNNPPITVSKGLNTTDEMFLCYFIYADYETGDETIVMDSSYLTVGIDTSLFICPTNIDSLPDTTSTDTIIASIPLTDSHLPNIYPNPCFDKISIYNLPIGAETIAFTIRDITGKIIIQSTRYRSSTIWQEQFDISSLATGLYFLEWRNNKQVFSKRFIKM